jgi:uncharacterized protein (TIGR03435 family)
VSVSVSSSTLRPSKERCTFSPAEPSHSDSSIRDNADPRAVIVMNGRIADGEAEGRNASTDYLTQRLSRYLRFPVRNETRLSGTFDFLLDPDDPENRDLVAATRSVVDRLGLKLRRGRGPIATLVIDHVEPPSEN